MGCKERIQAGLDEEVENCGIRTDGQDHII
jgi:hypothetical protein